MVVKAALEGAVASGCRTGSCRDTCGCCCTEASSVAARCLPRRWPAGRQRLLQSMVVVMAAWLGCLQACCVRLGT